MTPTIKNSLSLLLSIMLLLVSAEFVSAQRLGIHYDKAFANDSIMNRSMGVGGTFVMDGWHPNLDVQIDFDYTFHRGEKDIYGCAVQFDKYAFGLSALYTRPIGSYFQFRAGGGLSYHNIKRVEAAHNEEVEGAPIISTVYRANMLAVGATVQLQLLLGKFVRLGAGVTPRYLFPLTAKCDAPHRELKYNKGIFSTLLQIGIEVKLSNN